VLIGSIRLEEQIPATVQEYGGPSAVLTSCVPRNPKKGPSVGLSLLPFFLPIGKSRQPISSNALKKRSLSPASNWTNVDPIIGL
jgi:hypothetical protein